MMPLVSILIPAYNAEAWLAQTLQSATAQTWPNKEIVVVDDGSVDGTLRVARRFESESVHVVTQKNSGAAAARNLAFSLSRGEYIQWLDADDLLSSDKIAQQMKFALSGVGRRTLLSASWGQFLYRPERTTFKASPLWCDLSPSEFLIRKLTHKAAMQTATWLVSRELTEAAGPWNTLMLSDDDGEYFCRVLLASDGIRFAPEGRVYHRCVGRMRLSYVGQSNRKMEALWESMQLHIRYLRSLDDGAKARSACLRYLQNYVIDFYPQRLDIVKQMQVVAGELGGKLTAPHLSWKYAWIRVLFGWQWALRAQVVFPDVKWSLIRIWDNALWHLETEGVPKM